MNLSFCGCGFLGIYHLGVAQALVNHGPRLLNRVEKVAGASAGSLVAAALVCNPEKLEESKKFSLETARYFRKSITKAPSTLLPTLESFLQTYLPADSYRKASGKVYVSLTALSQWRPRHELVTNFTSNSELIETLLVSCSIPAFTSQKLPQKDGKMYLDGGFSNNLYQFDEGRTITISPFIGNVDISPKGKSRSPNIRVSKMQVALDVQNIKLFWEGFYPPQESSMLAYFDQGYSDAVNFLRKENFYDECVGKKT